ncbi:unnamed protein product [Caenorhabditis auriculariae]|uniref:Uncharacterized protein n=1 Tax=Caenorhabditis auriculariae TaxID=2777116 RepID=A0A8S1HQN0_9PELO|nr:unnamed protein product [Caenorhabditis auriculariae]
MLHKELLENPVYGEMLTRGLITGECTCYRITWSKEFFYASSVGLIVINLVIVILFFTWSDVIFGGTYGPILPTPQKESKVQAKKE